MVVANMDGPTRDQILKFMDQRDNIEREIQELSLILELNNVGMNDPLVDSNGFPRNDIDVYRVRHARHRIICLQNDHKGVMKQIEQGLHILHARVRGAGPAGPSQVPRTQASAEGFTVFISPDAAGSGHRSANCVTAVDSPKLTPFVKVNFVSAGSPAEECGIKVEDEIVEFGSVNSSNFKDLNQIGEIVKHSVNSQITVRIHRAPEKALLTVSLTPKTWSGRGLLGCNIVPIEN